MVFRKFFRRDVASGMLKLQSFRYDSLTVRI
jgi:hypothetical protein